MGMTLLFVELEMSMGRHYTVRFKHCVGKVKLQTKWSGRLKNDRKLIENLNGINKWFYTVCGFTPFVVLHRFWFYTVCGFTPFVVLHRL